MHETMISYKKTLNEVALPLDAINEVFFQTISLPEEFWLAIGRALSVVSSLSPRYGGTKN